MSSHFDEVLLGFDALELRAPEKRPDGPGGWPREYLLRTDLDQVLSADRIVWPSIFGPGGLPAPQWIGMNAPFWDDLEAMRSAIPQGFHREHAYRIVAATWHTDIGFEAEERTPGKILGPHRAPTAPAKRDVAWRLLGFDITDPGISGLTNCGYSQAERETLGPVWARHLNRHHLFQDVEPALAFRQLTNARVPEHAPFCVLGLWEVAG